MAKTKNLKGAFLAGLLVVISFWAGFSLNSYWQEKNSSSNSHRPPPPSPTPLPLLAYSLTCLKSYSHHSRHHYFGRDYNYWANITECAF